MSDRRSTGPVGAEEFVTSDPVAFARAVEELPIGVIVHQGPDHIMLGANRTARAFWGHRPGILGRPPREAYGDELLGALARLDRLATRTPRARGATVSLALIDPKDGSLSYVCAGHPSPLVLSADGATRFLPAPGGGPLGVALLRGPPRSDRPIRPTG